MLRSLLLESHPHIVVAHLAWHGLRENFFKSGHGLPGAVTRSRGTVDLRGPVLIKAHREFRSQTRFESCQGRKRHHLVLVVSHEELADILSPGPVIAFGLDVYLPLPAEAVEIINKQPAHESLDCLVDIAYRHTLLNDFVSVHIDELLPHTRHKSVT